MKKTNQPLYVSKDDYGIIMEYLKGSLNRSTFSRRDAELLELELKRAMVLDRLEMPGDAVGLNSLVSIRDEKSRKDLQLTIVTPEKADINQRKISVLSPIGVALFGYRKGESITWEVPAGRRTYSILEVRNRAEETLYRANSVER